MKAIRSISLCLLTLGAVFNASAAITPGPTIAVAPAWYDRYERSGIFDTPFDIAVDGFGNSYVTGISVDEFEVESVLEFGPAYLTVKYNSVGEKLWEVSSPGTPSAQAIDASGNVYVTGDNGTIKYDADGNEVWVAEAPFLFGERIKVDPNGNVYVAGYRLSEGTFGDLSSATVKFDTNGVVQWEQNIPEFSIVGLELDGSGNICVGGNTGPLDGLTTNTVVKYNSDSNVVYTVERAFGRNDLMNAMAVDTSGNVYLTGSSLDYAFDGSPLVNFMTMKFDTAGNTWDKYFDGAIQGYDEAFAIDTDSAGNIYVAGVTTLTKSGVFTSYIIKYDSNGDTLWAKTGPNKFIDPTALTVDNQDNVYITAMVNEKTYDFGTVKYGPDGTQKWSITTGGYQLKDEEFDYAQDRPFGIAVDNQGGIYVTGFFGGVGSYAWGVVKYKESVPSGIYNGLFFETNCVSHHSSGFITVKAATNGNYTGKLLIDGNTFGFSGKVNDLGYKRIFRGKFGKEDLRLSIGFTSSGQLDGKLSSTCDWVAKVGAEHAPFNKTNNATALANQYTMLLPGCDDPENSPSGYGFAAFQITTNGLTKIQGGSTADGQKLKQAVGVSAGGLWPFYVPTHKGTCVYTNLLTDQVKTNKNYYYGSTLGWIQLAGDTASGDISLIKTETTNGVYLAGYTNISEAYAQCYVVPGMGTNVFGSNQALLTLTNGNISTIEGTATISTNNKVVVTSTNNVVKLMISPKTGLLSGVVIDPVSSAKLIYKGVIMQDDQFAGGYFLGTNQTGKFTLEGN